MNSYLLMFPGLRNFLVFSGFGLSLLPLVFSLILTVASIFLHPYLTSDKKSRLMVKRFSTVRNTQERFTELHGKEKSEEGGRGDQEDKRGNQKGGEQASH